MVVEKAQNLARMWLRKLDSHPLTTTFVTVSGFTAAGVISWSVMEFLEAPVVDAKKKQPMTLEEAKLRAMIENAQTSSWQENLENASSAQAQFMIPGRPMKKPDFMEQIDKRTVEIMNEQHAQVEKEKQRRPTSTRIWSD